MHAELVKIEVELLVGVLLEELSEKLHESVELDAGLVHVQLYNSAVAVNRDDYSDCPEAWLLLLHRDGLVLGSPRHSPHLARSVQCLVQPDNCVLPFIHADHPRENIKLGRFHLAYLLRSPAHINAQSFELHSMFTVDLAKFEHRML